MWDRLIRTMLEDQCSPKEVDHRQHLMLIAHGGSLHVGVLMECDVLGLFLIPMKKVTIKATLEWWDKDTWHKLGLS